MPTILLKKSDTASAVPTTANLTNLAGGVEVAVNTADRRMFTMNSSSAVVELGTNPTTLTVSGAANITGNLGVGGTAQANIRVHALGDFAVLGGNANSTAFGATGTVPTSITSTARGFYTSLTTAASFTLSNLYHFQASNVNVGAGATVTNQIGFLVGSGLNTATNNYGFYSDIASGSNRWNFYANGTADNYFAGNVGIGTATPGTRLTVSSATNAGISVTDGTVTTIMYNSTGGVASIGTTSNHGVNLLTNNATRVTFDSSGNVGIGKTASTNKLEVSGNISDIAGNIRAIPRTGSAKTSVYTLSISDVGQFVELGTGGGIDVPNGIFSTGDVVSVFNNTTGNRTVSLTITTAYIAGTDADKASVTLATRGVATVLFISNSVCVVSGNVT